MKAVKIIKDLPALETGKEYPVVIIIPEVDYKMMPARPAVYGIEFEHKREHHWYFLDFMLDFPEYFQMIN